MVNENNEEEKEEKELGPTFHPSPTPIPTLPHKPDPTQLHFLPSHLKLPPNLLLKTPIPPTHYPPPQTIPYPASPPPKKK